jgi:hypothetical protein
VTDHTDENETTPAALALLEASAEATDKSPSSLVVYRTREPEVHCAGE